jgi:hypothetical protein
MVFDAIIRLRIFQKHAAHDPKNPRNELIAQPLATITSIRLAYSTPDCA